MGDGYAGVTILTNKRFKPRFELSTLLLAQTNRSN